MIRLYFDTSRGRRPNVTCLGSFLPLTLADLRYVVRKFERAWVQL